MPDVLPPLRDVIARYALQADKSRGQNFILDLNITHRIAALAGDLTQCDVIEIGAGPGGLTRALLDAGARRVIALETDARFLPALDEIATAYPNRLVVKHADALKTPLAQLTNPPYKIVANLPYNIATPLLVGWLKSGWHNGNWQPAFVSMTLMFQKEVAARIAAPPNSAAYGRLSVLAQWLCDITLALTLPPQAFTPPPKVDSAVVHFTPRPMPCAPADPDMLETLLATCFAQRRKMLRVSLKRLCSDAERVLADVAIDGTARPETLSVVDFCRLATRIGESDEKPSHN